MHLGSGRPDDELALQRPHRRCIQKQAFLPVPRQRSKNRNFCPKKTNLTVVALPKCTPSYVVGWWCEMLSEQVGGGQGAPWKRPAGSYLLLLSHTPMNLHCSTLTDGASKNKKFLPVSRQRSKNRHFCPKKTNFTVATPPKCTPSCSPCMPVRTFVILV